MAKEETVIKLRIDVDYPYPSSRFKSFFYVTLKITRIKTHDYLRNARVIADMINASSKKVRAYWFFTPYAIPDKQLLNLLVPERHVLALHIANNATKEWADLEKKTNRKVQYFTVHGTSGRLSQILWKRKLGQKQALVPLDFPLKSFHDFKTTSLDRRVFEVGLDSVKEEAKVWIAEGTVISIHPEWLYKLGKKNRRGPYYEALKSILGVD